MYCIALWSINSCRTHPNKTKETVQWGEWSHLKTLNADPIPATLTGPAGTTAILALGILLVSAATATWEDSLGICFFLILTPESGVDECDWWSLCHRPMSSKGEGKNENLGILVSILGDRLDLSVRRGIRYWEVKESAKHALKSTLAHATLTWTLPPIVKNIFPPT